MQTPSPAPRLLLVKRGRRFGLHRKRHCELHSSGLLIYYSSKSSPHPKGRFNLTPPLEIKEITSFLKEYENCLFVKAKDREFWLFPQDLKEKAHVIILLKGLEKISNRGIKRVESQKHLRKGSTKTTLNRSLDSGLQRTAEHENGMAFDQDVIRNHIHQHQETLLEQSFEEDPLEITLEGCLPKEIKALKGPGSHILMFQEAKSSKKGQRNLNLEQMGNNNNEDRPDRDLFQRNGQAFRQYQEKKDALAQKFLFPKREDSLGLEGLKDLELSDEFLLGLAQQFLWEFQLENAVRVLKLRSGPEFDVGLFEVELMKVLVSGKRNIIERLSADITNKLMELKNKAPDLIISELNLVKGMLLILMQSKFQAFLSLKQAYNFLKKAEKANKFQENSRYLLLSGAFQVGLSLLPTQYRKILEFLGLSIDRDSGVKTLKICIAQNKLRANYARLLLGLYFIEGDQSSFDQAFSLIQTSLSLPSLAKSPLMNWLGSLFSWRFMQGTESVKLVLRGLAGVGGELAREAHYLRFELAWFELSRCRWAEALAGFESLVVQALDLTNFDLKTIREVPPAFETLIKRAIGEGDALERYARWDDDHDEKKNRTIVMPHRNTLALLIGICYEGIGDTKMCEFWLSMIEYIEKRFNGESVKSCTDQELGSWSRKLRKRSYKFLVKYEVLYFLKEAAKLSDRQLSHIKASSHEFFARVFGIEPSDHQKILSVGKKDLAMLPEYASYLFLGVIIHCLLRDFDAVLLAGTRLKDLEAGLNGDWGYLLHHGFHWTGRSLLVEGRKKEAAGFLRLAKKYQDCEFALKVKTAKFLKEAEVKD